MTSQTQPQVALPTKVLPRLARVKGGKWLKVGQQYHFTYIGEMMGSKLFIPGDNYDPERTEMPVELQFNSDTPEYKLYDVVTATAVGTINDDVLWAISPRPPRFIEVSPSILVTSTQPNYIWHYVEDPDNPDYERPQSAVLRGEPANPEIITVKITDTGSVLYEAHSEGGTSIRLDVITGTGQASVNIPVRVDFHAPWIKFHPKGKIAVAPWDIVYIDAQKSYNFEVMWDVKLKYGPEYSFELISLNPNEEMGDVDVHIETNRQVIQVMPRKAGKLILRVHITNAGKPCYADLYLKIYPSTTRERHIRGRTLE